jgi:uncharacterized protein (DUF1501 family)
MMTFSEFGRRVAGNQPAGTDHGSANLMFLTGGGPQGGSPELTNQDESGESVRNLYFRSVYAESPGRWFGAEVRKVPEGSSEPANVLKPRGTFA